MKRGATDAASSHASKRALAPSSSAPTAPSAPVQPDAFALLMQSDAARKRSLAASAPSLIQTPSQILDRFSKFVSHSAKVSSRKDVLRVQAHLAQTQLFKSATHNIQAWRFLKLIANRKGDSPSDFIVEEDFDEDGEKDAGRRLVRVLQEMGACDVMVIVSRWFGGTNLGPVRFDHINNMGIAALEAGGFLRTLNPSPTSSSTPCAFDTIARDVPPTSMNVAPPNWNSIADKDRVARQLTARTASINSFAATATKLEASLTDKETVRRSLRGKSTSKVRTSDDNAAVTAWLAMELEGLASNNEALEAGQDVAEDMLRRKVALFDVLKGKVTALKDRITLVDKEVEELSFTMAMKPK